MTFRELVETHYPTFTEWQKDTEMVYAESYDDGECHEVVLAIAVNEIPGVWGHAADGVSMDDVSSGVKVGMPYLY